MKNMTNEQYKSILRAIKQHAEETQSIQKIISLINTMLNDNDNNDGTKEKTGDTVQK